VQLGAASEWGIEFFFPLWTDWQQKLLRIMFFTYYFIVFYIIYYYTIVNRVIILFVYYIIVDTVATGASIQVTIQGVAHVLLM
jgi:hypothetical protein